MKTLREQLTYAINTNQAWVSKFCKVSDKLDIAVEALESIENTFEIDWNEAQDIAREALKKIDRLRPNPTRTLEKK